MGTIRLENVRKTYDRKTFSVKNFSLDIREGEFIILVGPSGCGKTTTLRMIAGLEEVSDGKIYIEDKLVNQKLPKDRDLAMVFQNYALYPHMTVFENMAYPLKIRKIPKEKIESTVQETAKMLGIYDQLHKKPAQLSGGQKQRVALGRCMVRQPKAFLMDEPLSNLDAKLRVQMRSEIINIQKRLHKTFIYVTHDQTEAMTMGDRIVVMNDGDIMQIGTAKEVYENPVNKFVAEFIGSPSMNFLPFQREPVQLNDRVLDSSRSVFLGIRPEKIVPYAVEDSFSFRAEVVSIEPLGAENYIYILVNGERFIVRDFTLQKLKIGETYPFYIKKDDLYYFDFNTQNRIG